MGAAYWLLFTLIVAVAARSRGRSFIVWFIFALLLSPLIAGVALLLMSNLRYRRATVIGFTDALHDAQRSVVRPYVFILVFVAALAALHLALR